jgi:hypothetical protein
MRSLLVCAFLLTVPLGAQEPDPPAATAPAPTPKIPLDLAWFGLPADALKPHDLADLGWEKPALKLGGRSIRVVWEEPKWADPTLEADNLAAGETHRKNFPAYLQASLAEFTGVKADAEAGDLVLTGRLLDCNIKGGFLSMAWEDITWDLKLVDPATGETLAAFRNRLLGGNGWKGNGSRKRFLSWTEKFAKYAKGHWLP